MKIKCTLTFEIDTEQYTDVATDEQANDCVHAMINGEADFPEQITITTGKVKRTVDN